MPPGPEISSTGLKKLNFNQRQNDGSLIVRSPIINGALLQSISGGGVSDLKAQKTLFNEVNSPVPKNQ
jgi:hypothetical protein